MDDILAKLLIICPGYLIAGFADSVAGGGGTISVPFAMLSGLPIHTVYGTNKFAMAFGTFISTVKYGKNKVICWRNALIAAAGAIGGSAFGARLTLMLSEKYLSYCLMVLLPAAALFLCFNKGFGENPVPKGYSPLKEGIISLLIGAGVGTYDGFFGPGAGTFYMALFCTLLGMDLLRANGSSKVINLASNIGALVTFALNGRVFFAVGIPAAICAILGNYIGSSMAIKNGAKFIRPVMAIMIVLLFIKVITEFAL